MNAYYTIWIEQIAREGAVGLILAAAALNVVLIVTMAQPRHKLTLLRIAAFGYGVLSAVILAAGVLAGEFIIPTGGFLLHKPLWYDETFTALVSSLPFPRMLSAVAGDVHPPLWYIVEWAVVRVLGRSEIALRLPALVFAAVSVYVTYRAALALDFRRETATLAAVILALLPGQVYYAQEARMYALLEAAVLMAALGIFTRRPWLMVAGMTAALYTHNLGAVYVAVLAALYIYCEGVIHLFKLLSGDVRFPKIAAIMLWDSLLPLLAVAGSYLPWAYVATRQAAAVGDGFWLPSYGIGGYVTEWARAALMGAPAHLAVSLTLVVVGMAALVAVKCPPQQRRVLLPLAFGPPVAMALVSIVWRPLFLHRAIIPTLPFLAIGAAAALDALSERPRRVIMLVTALSLILSVGFVQKREGEMVRWLADQVRDRCELGAVVWHANLASYISMAYYLPDCQQAVWPDAGNLSQALTIPTQDAMGIHRAGADDVDGDLIVVWVENPMTTPGEIAAMDAALALGWPALIVAEEHPLMRVQVWDVYRKSTSEEVKGK